MYIQRGLCTCQMQDNILHHYYNKENKKHIERKKIHVDVTTVLNIIKGLDPLSQLTLPPFCPNSESGFPALLCPVFFVLFNVHLK